MSDLHRYYSINLVPREKTEDGFKIGYGEPAVVVLEIPGDNRGIVTCSKYTNYGMALFLTTENFELGFQRLRMEQIKNMLEVVNEAMSAGANGAADAYKEASRLCSAILELTQLQCPVPDDTLDVRSAPATCAPGVDVIEKRITAVQKWRITDEGAEALGWTLEDNSALPDDVVMVEVVEAIQISEDLELPAKAIFKLRNA